MSVLTLILAGGEGSRLSILGEKRAKPAVPFGGKYRIIDFPLSNAVNSELYRVAVLTQYRPHSLMQHLGIGEPWDLNRRGPTACRSGSPTAGAATRTGIAARPTRCTRTARFIADDRQRSCCWSSPATTSTSRTTAICCAFTRSKGADLTVAVMHVRPDEVHRFGIMSVDADQRITRFAEKPKQSDSTLASMGIYVFNTAFLLRRLEEDAQDPNIGPRLRQEHHPQAWSSATGSSPTRSRAIGSTSAPSRPTGRPTWRCWRSSPALDLYDPRWVIHTRSEERPPVKFGPSGEVHNSLLSNGCVINGTVINSVLSPGVRVERGAVVRDSVIMNDTTIKAGAQVDRCVLDKEVEIGADAQVGVGDDNTPNAARAGQPQHRHHDRREAGAHPGRRGRSAATAGSTPNVTPERLRAAGDRERRDGEPRPAQDRRSAEKRNGL